MAVRNFLIDEDVYLHYHPYVVGIDFFTIEDEAFNVVRSILKFGMDIAIQEGARKIVGITRLLDYQYLPQRTTITT